jgi:hypothetical protein
LSKLISAARHGALSYIMRLRKFSPPLKPIRARDSRLGGIGVASRTCSWRASLFLWRLAKLPGNDVVVFPTALIIGSDAS